LRDLGQRMQTISSDTLDSQRVAVESQPRELAPIAVAFNDLLDRLSASWERQRGFANGVSHELRTPISLIRNYASSLRRRSQDLSDQQAEQLALIEVEASRMGKLVADLLALTRIDAHRTLMPFEPFDVAEAIERVAERLRSRCFGRLRICPGATQSARTFALGDADRFEQCLVNLIENAQKYDPGAGPIQLRLDASLDRVVVHVIDAGPGVPDNEKQLIFERFGRGRHASAIPGSGVGLAVVRALMEAMGGSVSVADAPQGGADFQLRLKGAAPLHAA
jgi:signal transduction histidine kinase